MSNLLTVYQVELGVRENDPLETIPRPFSTPLSFYFKFLFASMVTYHSPGIPAGGLAPDQGLGLSCRDMVKPERRRPTQ
jgi:hypothetical protein